MVDLLMHSVAIPKDVRVVGQQAKYDPDFKTVETGPHPQGPPIRKVLLAPIITIPRASVF
jgi:hypothetical protein